MARGPKRHMKRVAAPSHWMLDKLKGVYAPRPSTGPHKLRECIPLVVLLRNRLKYALTYNEVKLIVMQRLIKVDGKVRTDTTYPSGFMDVVSINKTGEHFRLLLDTKGRFRPHKIRAEEAVYKLCKVKKVVTGSKGVPSAITHDGRTVRYIHPEVKANDSIVLDIAKGTPEKWIKFEVGKMAMITGGHNVGRVGTIVHRERHPGSFEIIHVKDAANHHFATRINNVFIIGENDKSFVSLPKGNGIRKTILEDREEKIAKDNLHV